MAITTKTKTGGDDLDDQFDLDPDLIASGSELGDEDDEGSGSGDEDPDVEAEGDRPVFDEDDVEADGRLNDGVKRKAGDGEEDAERMPGSANADGAEDKKRRKKEKDKERKAKRAMRDQPDSSVPGLPPTHLPAESLLALLRTSLVSSAPSITPMEITDRLPPLASILPPPEHAPPDLLSTSFDPLRRRVAGLLKKGKLTRGKPRIIILCLSGMRCVDVAREVREVKGEGQVAKLFAKHMKPAEQKKFLTGTVVSVAVGTPSRVGLFLADGTISVDKSTILLLDIGHKDSKTRTLLTMPEIRDDLWKAVFSGAARTALLDGGARIGAF